MFITEITLNKIIMIQRCWCLVAFTLLPTFAFWTHLCICKL